MAQEAAERPSVLYEVADSPAHAGLGVEASAVGTAPQEQLGKERSRLPLAQREMLVGADDARVLGLTLNTIDLADQLRKVNGRDVIDVRFRFRTPPKDDTRLPMELDTLTCFVQLHVPGVALEPGADGRSTLVVPTTHSGPKRLKVLCKLRRQTQGDSAHTAKVT